VFDYWRSQHPAGVGGHVILQKSAQKIAGTGDCEAD
jgi:hypothetical protein